MKKLAMFLGVLALMVVLGASQTGAALLGISRYQGNRPDIDFNNTGYISYDASTGLFTLTATDEKLVLPDGREYSLTWFTQSDTTITTLTLQIYVDKNGNLKGGVPGYDMVEKVTKGSVTIEGVTYDVGDVLLQADVKAFGWQVDVYFGNDLFDFLFDTLDPYSGLVKQGIWPYPLPLTGAYTTEGKAKLASGDNWTGDWKKSFEVIGVKGDKLPTPEPSSLLLLGSGLLGFGAYFRVRFGRKRR